MSTYVIRDIEMDPLDPSSIRSAIQEVEMVRDKLLPAMTHLIEMMIKEGVKIAKAELLAFEDPAYDTGSLYESIDSGMLDNETGVVTTGVMYAVYVEYGTGVFAENGGGRQSGWTYYDTLNCVFRHTHGMPPRPFMYNTLRSLEDLAEKEGGKILAEYLA